MVPVKLQYLSEPNVLTLIKKCSVIAVTSFNKNQLSLYPRINEFNHRMQIAIIIKFIIINVTSSY